MTQWKPKSRHSATKEKREARSENSSDSSNSTLSHLRATSSSQVKKTRFNAGEQVAASVVEYKLKAIGGEKFVGRNIRDLSTQKALMQWIEAEHLKMLYSKEEVEQAFGNSLSEEKFVDNCREYASRVMPDRADVYHSSMEDIINELLNIAVMDTYAAKAGDGATAKDRTDYHGTKADSAEVTSINGVLAKCGLPTISPTEATVEELQTAVDCIQRLAAAESDNLLPADINTLRVVLRDKYLDRCQSDVNHAMAELQGITANPVSDTSRGKVGR